MTNEEKQEIVNEVLAALQTHGKTIGQLTPVTSPSDSDTFELSGGRNLSYGKLKDLITAIFTAALNGYVPADALWEYIQQYVAKLGTNGAIDWQESPVVMLATMGTTYDNVDGELPAYTLQEGDMYYQYGVNYQIFRRLANGGGEGQPAKEGVVYFNMRTMRLYKWTGSTMVGIAKVGTRVINDLTTGGEGDALSAEQGKTLKALIDNMGIDVGSIIKDVTFSNGNLVFTFETSEGDKVVNVPLDIDLSGYVPVTRKVNGKALSQDITIGQSDISGLAAALAALVPQTRTVNGKALNGNIVIGMADIPGLLQAIANAGSGAVSVTTNQDGTFVIHVGSTDYTINLNHTHENMAKLVVDTAANLPDASEMESDTIYGELDDGEIATIYLGGYPFYGGGGGASSNLPSIVSPLSGTQIDFNGSSTKQVFVRGVNLGVALTIDVTGDMTASVQSISTTDAATGVNVTLTKGSGFTFGTLRIHSSEVDNTYNVIESQSYQSITAVKFTRQQCVLTDIYPGPQTRLEIDMKLDGDYMDCSSGTGRSYSVLGCPDEGSSTPKKAFRANTGVLTDFTNAAQTRSIFAWVEEVHVNTTYEIKVANANIKNRGTLIFDMVNHTASFNGASVAVPTKTITMQEPMYFGGSNTGIPFGLTDLIVYSIKHYEDNVLTHEYLPKTLGGIAGLYDTKTKTFITSETSVDLVAIS